MPFILCKTQNNSLREREILLLSSFIFWQNNRLKDIKYLVQEPVFEHRHFNLRAIPLITTVYTTSTARIYRIRVHYNMCNSSGKGSIHVTLPCSLYVKEQTLCFKCFHGFHICMFCLDNEMESSFW